MSGQTIAWKPQPGPQTDMLSCPYPIVLYGGQAGGGKSDGLIGDYSAGIEAYGAAWRGVIFRRTFPMLEEIETRALEIFSPVYGEKCYSVGRKRWTFPNGATLRLRFMDEDRDTLQYQGQQFTWVGWDELTQWPTDYCFNYMLSRTRSAGGAPSYTRATSNPGGPGHGWVKRMFIDPAPPRTPVVEWGKDIDGNPVKRTKVFIPARLRDNQILVKNDPLYYDRLNQLSDPVLRAALRDGNWDVFAGMAFNEWNRDIHVIPQRQPPEGVKMWRACDWGYDKPHCVLWFYSDFDGNVVVFNELYGKGDREGMGTREGATVVRDKILSYEGHNNLWVPTGYLDPQCWADHDEGDSIFHKLGGARLGWQKWEKGPGSRVIQKQIVHDYLKVVNGISRLKIMDNCVNLIRTMPVLPADPKKPEDVDTNAEDHAYDTLRGGLARKIMSLEDRRRVAGIRTRNSLRRRQYGGQFGGMG